MTSMIDNPVAFQYFAVAYKMVLTFHMHRISAMMFSPKLILMVSVVALAACASVTWDQVDLMPPPEVFGDGMLNPLPDQDPMELIPYQGLLYATDRNPATADDPESFYRNERGSVLRLGVARISLHEADVEWEEVRKISLLKNRTDKYPLRVTGVHEYGILEDTIPGFARREDYGEEVLDGDEEFAAAVNAQLARSKRKHVYIYVHGYKVVFENPMLVATELWHFLGYDGVMVGYAWPSTPSKWAYLRDTDTSNGFARHFRKFLEYLSEHTNAEEIHIVAYSNGTRMVTRAFEQLALMYHDETRDEIQAKIRLGNLILTGSDLDREVFAAYLADDVLDVPRHLSVYVSDKDKALGFSRWLTRRERLGQMIKPENMTPQIRRLLTESKDYISVIDVSDAEGADTGNGHGYFRSSPWASSDILMTLMYDLAPQQRGLQLRSDMPVYDFPPDYMSELWAALAEVNPEFRRAYMNRKAR
jgi:esterase/lipase superfamily enzyme